MWPAHLPVTFALLSGWVNWCFTLCARAFLHMAWKLLSRHLGGKYGKGKAKTASVAPGACAKFFESVSRTAIGPFLILQQCPHFAISQEWPWSAQSECQKKRQHRSKGKCPYMNQYFDCAMYFSITVRGLANTCCHRKENLEVWFCWMLWWLAWRRISRKNFTGTLWRTFFWYVLRSSLRLWQH